MLRVAEILEVDEHSIDEDSLEDLAPMPNTRITQRINTGHGADRHVAIRALAEQLVGEANAVITNPAEDHGSLSGCKGYLCGPPLMVEAALKTLMGERLFPRDIYREEFFNEGDKSGGVNSPLIKR